MRTIAVLTMWGLSLFTLMVPIAHAQESPEVIVRPGDTIEWEAVTAGPHQVKFGADGASPVAEVSALLEFTPALVNGESPKKPTGKLLTAKVKDNAEEGKTFVFTCGVHPAQMLSFPFIVGAKVAGQPARTHRISGITGLHWRLHIDTKP